MKKIKRPGPNKYENRLVNGLVAVNMLFAVLALLSPVFAGWRSDLPIVQTQGWQLFQTVCLAGLTFGLMGMMIYLGIRSIGYSEGIDSFFGQIRHVLWRLFLYIFLPAGLITLVLVAFALYRRWLV